MTVKLPPTLICGVSRNAGPALSQTLAKIERLKDLIEDWLVLVVTNDNTDGSDAVLDEWVKTDTRHHVIRMDGLLAAYPNRTDRIAVARNAYLHYLRSLPEDKFAYLLIMDFDGLNTNIDPPGAIAAIIKVKENWAGLFANQRQAYYDIYALRHSEWCSSDCWEDIRRAKRYPMRLWRKKAAIIEKFVFSRQYLIPPDSGVINVMSAFGGMAIYKVAALDRCWYGSRNRQGRPVCEHVIFNGEVVRNGGSLYIVSDLLNDAPTEHLGTGSGGAVPPRLFC
jgi:hypothetical protein